MYNGVLVPFPYGLPPEPQAPVFFCSFFARNHKLQAIQAFHFKMIFVIFLRKAIFSAKFCSHVVLIFLLFLLNENKTGVIN